MGKQTGMTLKSSQYRNRRLSSLLGIAITLVIASQGRLLCAQAVDESAIKTRPANQPYKIQFLGKTSAAEVSTVTEQYSPPVVPVNSPQQVPDSGLRHTSPKPGLAPRSDPLASTAQQRGLLPGNIVRPVAHSNHVRSEGVILSQQPVVVSEGFDSFVPSLDGRRVACEAARNWTPADVLRSRGRTLVQIYAEEDDCERAAACALVRFLNMQAAHQEDIGAASALRAYYTRIALAEQLAVAAESLELVESEMSKQAALQQGGIASGFDRTAFERQRIDMTDKSLQVQSQDRQLRTLLAHLTHIDYGENDFRQEQLDVVQCRLDCEQIKHAALHTRHDLQGWIYLSQQVNETSAPIFAKMLTTIVGSWGLPIPTISGLKNLLCPPDYSGLAANMRKELNLVVETHRRWISQAIDEKCSKVVLTYQRIDLAQQKIASWQQRIEQLQRLSELGQSQPEEIAQARVALLEARVEEIYRRLEARTAEIDLSEAAGGIANRCCTGEPWMVTGYEQ